MGKASGSEERVRQTLVGVRLLPEEREALDAAADEAGMARGCFIRHQVFGNPGPRARRRPTLAAEGAARLLAHLGKVGSNINQLSRVANADGHLPTQDQLLTIRTEVVAMRNELLQALGRQSR